MTRDRANIIAFDIGSTFTKAVAFRLENEQLTYLMRTQSPTTLDHVMKGVDQTLKSMQENIALDESVEYYATCSAAGGLRMVAMGYMPHVTAKAAKEVAMSAGARVLEVVSHDESADRRLEILREIQPNIILLAGGTDGGETASAIENAEIIVRARLNAIVVIACNKDAQGIVAELLSAHGVDFKVVPNIMPTIHTLNVKPARRVIHQEFIKQLTKVKGLNELAELVADKEVRPTPGAVLLTAELWAQGNDDDDGLGDVLLIDVGGATTDIHSVLTGIDRLKDEEIGLILNNEKQSSYRTVEGNLGLSVSATGILEAIGKQTLLRLLPEAIKEQFAGRTDAMLDAISAFAHERETNTSRLAVTDEERAFEMVLTVVAIYLALNNHAGHIMQEYDPRTGILPGFPVGRDLRGVKHVIGIGGIFANNSPEHNEQALETVFTERGMSLFPSEPVFHFDTKYISFALGTLSLHYPDAVLAFMKSAQYTGGEVNRDVADVPSFAEPMKVMDEVHAAWYRDQAERMAKERQEQGTKGDFL